MNKAEGSTRRAFAGKMPFAGVLAVLLTTSRAATACLYGKWDVMCPNQHVDRVDAGTCQHKCEKCGVQVFDGSKVTVVCPNGHQNRIDTASCRRACTSFECSTCGKECQRG